MSAIPEYVMKAAEEALQKTSWSMVPVEEWDAAVKIIARAILAERERSRTALSEAKQRARWEALGEAAQIVIRNAPETQDFADAPLQDHAARAAKAIRSLIPSEPHDAEGRETTRRGDPSIFDDAEGRN